MEDIEQYQSRITAALDRISKEVANAGTRETDDDHLRQRDAALIEELEATLKEERADLVAERSETTRLRAALQTAEAAGRSALADRDQALAKVREARAAAANGSQPGGALESKIERLNARIENQDIQFQRLKAATAQLRESIGILRTRNADMLADPAAIDQSLRVELEALKSTRAADVDEMDTILEELKPLVEGQVNA